MSTDLLYLEVDYNLLNVKNHKMNNLQFFFPLHITIWWMASTNPCDAQPWVAPNRYWNKNLVMRKL